MFLDCLKSIEHSAKHFRACVEMASIAEIRMLFYYNVSMISSRYGYKGPVTAIVVPSRRGI